MAAAIDGPDAAGKTTLAAAIAARAGSDVLRLSVDDHQLPRARRYARGPQSPDGYLEDSFDVGTIAASVRAFSRGEPRILLASFDLTADRPAPRWATTKGVRILLVDGVFLQRGELRRLWRYVTYLHVPERVSLERALVRDAVPLGGRGVVGERYRARYLPAQRRYRDRCAPVDRADLLVDNRDAGRPLVIRDRLSGGG